MVVEYGIDAIEPYPVNELSEYNLSAAKVFGEYYVARKLYPMFSMLGSLKALTTRRGRTFKGLHRNGCCHGRRNVSSYLVPL